MSYTYNVGDLVDAPGAAGMRPALIRKFVSHDSVVVDYIAKAFGSREVKVILLDAYSIPLDPIIMLLSSRMSPKQLDDAK